MHNPFDELHNPKLSLSMVFATPSAHDAAGLPRARLREALLRKRDELPQRAQREAALDAALDRELRGLQARCIGAYCASRNEYDALRVLARVGAELGWPWRIALPVVQRAERAMRFCAWAPGQALRAGPYGIEEPADCGLELEPDTLLVPCVGFADDGLRLGYGGGYYDRYLQHRPRVLCIGVAFDACRVEGLAAQPHDRPLDIVLTESRRYLRAPSHR